MASMFLSTAPESAKIYKSTPVRRWFSPANCSTVNMEVTPKGMLKHGFAFLLMAPGP